MKALFGNTPSFLLVDTNIWLDYFNPSRPNAKAAFELFDHCYAHSIELCYTSASIKDVFFIFSSDQKREIRQEHGTVTESEANAVNEMAWGCIRHMYEVATPIPETPEVLCEAFNLKAIYHDFEDDIVIAAAKLANVDFLVTNDQTLIAKAMVPALSAADMLAHLKLLC